MTVSSPKKIIVAGSIRIYREGIRLFLEQFDDIVIAGVVSDCEELVDCCCKLKSDVVLVDARTPGVLTSLSNLKNMLPRVRVVVLAATLRREQLFGFLEAGDVAEFVTEDDSLEQLRFAIDSAVQNRFSCSSKLAHLLMDAPGKLQISKGTKDFHLTRRQIRVLELIETGKSNKEIARFLNIETTTVKNHVHQILRRLSVKTRCEAAAKYRRIITNIS